MDNKTNNQVVDVIDLPWTAIDTNITREGRGNVGTEKGDLVYTNSGVLGVLTNTKTMTVFGETITEDTAKVDIAKNKIRTTTFYDADAVPVAAGDAIHFVVATGKLASTAIASGVVYAGIYLGIDADAGTISYMLQ